MDLQLLGPVEARVDGRAVALGRRKERALLAILACRPRHFVSVDRLADLLWEEHPPEHARTGLQAMVSHLRAALRSAGDSAPRLVAGGSGYALDIEPERIDLHRFRSLVADAHNQGNAAERARLFADALRLWRGEPLADVVSPSQCSSLVPDAHELLLVAREGMLEAQLDLGDHRSILADLTALVSEHPLRERPVQLLMLALHRSGRRSEALDAYSGLDRRLGDELGICPNETVQKLYVAILRDDPDLGSASGTSVALDMLPRALPELIGRDDELAVLNAAVASGRAPIIVISGPGGVGKTALAVQWGRSRADDYPDGLLFVDLRGFDPREPMDPSAALSMLLGALGVEPKAIPTDADAAAAMYRSQLTGKRTLLVLDNAATAEQIRCLIPAAETVTVLVTSRSKLTGLTMSHGATGLSLNRLSRKASLALVRSVVSYRRVDREPQAADEMAGLCDDLPLALRIASALINAQPDLELEQYVRQTRAHVLDSIEITDDLTTGLRAVFGHSFLSLPSRLRELFILLSVPAGSDFSAPAVAALLGLTPADAQHQLEALCEAHLVERSGSARYSMHSLTRAYAGETAHAHPESLAYARERLMAYYVHTADNASIAGVDAKLKLPRDAVPEAVTPTQFSDGPAAREWFRLELDNLIAEAVHAAQVGPLRIAWQLADALHTYFWTHREFTRWIAVLDAGISAARQSGDEAALANLVVRRGNAHWVFAEHELAEQIYQEALEINTRIGRLNGVAGVHESLVALYTETGRLKEAKASAEVALQMYTELDRSDNQAFILAAMGIIAHELDDIEESISFSLRAAEIHREKGMKQALAAPLLQAATSYLERVPPDLDNAQRVAQEALTASESVASAIAISGAHSVLARIFARSGHGGEAMTHADLAVTHAVESQHKVSECFALLARGEVKLRTNGPAADDFAAALRISEQVTYPQGQVQALIGLAQSAGEPGAHLDRASAVAARFGLLGLQRKIAAVGEPASVR